MEPVTVAVLVDIQLERRRAGGPVNSRAEIPASGQAAVLTIDFFFCLLNPLSSKTSEARSQTWLQTAVGMAVLERRPGLMGQGNSVPGWHHLEGLLSYILAQLSTPPSWRLLRGL